MHLFVVSSFVLHCSASDYPTLNCTGLHCTSLYGKALYCILLHFTVYCIAALHLMMADEVISYLVQENPE